MNAPLLVAALAALASGAAESPPVPPAATGAAEEPAEPPAPPTATAVAAPRPPRTWFFLPTLFYLPETRLGLAVAAGRDYRMSGSPRASSALGIAAVGIDGLGSAELSTEMWFRDGSLLAARLRALRFPDRFYGIGPSSPSAGWEPFTRRFVELFASGEAAALDGRLRAGPQIAGRVEDLTGVVPGGRLETSGLPGVDGFSGVGLGASVTWDTRDAPLSTREGVYAQALYIRYPAALGRHDGFGKGGLDLRAFHPVGRSVLALSGEVDTADGATPFTLLPKLGSARFLRGYREGRWRDQLSWTTQAELRTPIWGPLGAAIFASAGDVAPDVASLSLDRIKAAGGVGARWRVTPAGVNVRVDVALGSEGPQVYVLLLDAF